MQGLFIPCYIILIQTCNCSSKLPEYYFVLVRVLKKQNKIENLH